MTRLNAALTRAFAAIPLTLARMTHLGLDVIADESLRAACALDDLSTYLASWAPGNAYPRSRISAALTQRFATLMFRVSTHADRAWQSLDEALATFAD